MSSSGGDPSSVESSTTTKTIISDEISSTIASVIGSTTIVADDSHHSNLLQADQEIFLRSASAKCISGVFAWAALLITCHQVSVIFIKSYLLFYYFQLILMLPIFF